jgi:hypothetical protein
MAFAKDLSSPIDTSPRKQKIPFGAEQSRRLEAK